MKNFAGILSFIIFVVLALSVKDGEIYTIRYAKIRRADTPIRFWVFAAFVLTADAGLLAFALGLISQ